MKADKWSRFVCVIFTAFALFSGSMIVVAAQSSAAQIQTPDWAARATNAPVMKPPFEKVLRANQIVRIELVTDAEIKIIARNVSNKKGILTSVAFKDGRPIKEVSINSFSLTPNQRNLRITHKEAPAEADFIVVRVQKGMIGIKAELIESPAGIVLTRFEIKGPSGREAEINPRKKSLVRLTDVATDGKGSSGSLSIYATVIKKMEDGTSVYKREYLKTIDFKLTSGATDKWEFPREQKVDIVSIDVMKGMVNVHIEQPEKAGTNPAAWGRGPEAAGQKAKVESQKASSTQEEKSFMGGEIPLYEGAVIKRSSFTGKKGSAEMEAVPYIVYAQLKNRLNFRSACKNLLTR
ncbi:MAG: hypothetical protein DRH90_20700 [Deltaproteobacteria bacterium]|nr:MAG: hypothetical protein DRH90_20700 [Deltaproteobacteria bacterium]